MIRTTLRRLQRLEERAAVSKQDRSFSSRLIIVDPEKGATGGLVYETGKPSIMVPATPEEVEAVRADLEQRRARNRSYGSDHQVGHD